MRGRGLQARVRRAVANKVLERNVLRATNASTAHRVEAVGERPDWEALVARAARVRDHALGHLDRFLEEFAENARRRGAHVHSAPDAATARRIVLEILREHGATSILESKSMTREEVGLNAALEAQGFRPLETDLGEYIVQLAGEPPSHITAPALHRSAEQIRDLFLSEGVLEGRGPSPADRKDLATWLSLAAREHLRPRLLAADVGITGANFLVAETGTVVLLENEGNIRFTTTSPPLMIALVGIEKVVGRLEDLATLLPLLTRSATGQRATTYVSLISGPLTELHVILLDGSRSALLADREDREILRCIRCGACLNVCPVYRTVGGHAYGSAYPGPIGCLVTPLLRAGREDLLLPWFSSLCGACSDVCPVGIDLAGQLLRLRDRGVRAGHRGRIERLAFRLWRLVCTSPRRYRLALAAARALEGPARRLGFPRGWMRSREAPRLARPTFHELWPALAAEIGPGKGPRTPAPTSPRRPAGTGNLDRLLAPGPVPPSGMRIAGNLVQTFQAALEAEAGRVVTVPDEDAARRWLETELAGRRVVRAHEHLEKEDLERADVGVDEADLLVAETGTVVRSYPSRAASRVSLVPPTTVFVARADRIVSDLPTALAELAERHRASRAYTIFLTGPSRTADIEKQLVIPAHGPREFIVLLITGEVV